MMFFFTMRTNPVLVLCLGFSCWAVVTTGVLSLDEADRLYQRAQYQMEELEKTLRELHTTSHSIKKRSTGASERCVDLVRLVDQMCHNKNPGPTTTTSDVRTKPAIDEKDKLFEDLAFYKNGTVPDVILYKATAKRDGRNLEVGLELIHSSKIYAMRTMSFDAQKRSVESTKELGTFGNVQLKLSRISMNFDVSICWPRDDFGRRDEADVLIFSDDDAYLSSATARVDICGHDSRLDENGNWRNSSEYYQVLRSQTLQIPKYKILSDPGNTIFVARGDNPSFVMEMRLTRNLTCAFSYNLYDWQLKKYEQNWVTVRMPVSSEETLRIENEQETSANLLTVDTLDLTVLSYEESSDSDSDDYPEQEDGKRWLKEVDAKVRVTLNIGSREMSGGMHIGYRWRESDWETRHIIREQGTDRAILFKLPYKLEAYPPNSVQIYTSSPECDEDGNENSRKYGNDKHCTIDCHAWGTNIKSIFIVKSPYRFPVKSSSYVIKNVNAYAIQDVGPASDEVEGVYSCTVVLQNGRTKSKDMFLATSGFTGVENFTLEDTGNSTSRLICTVYGAPPLDITMWIYDSNWNEQRLDDKVGALRSIETFDDLTTELTLLIPTAELQYPRNDVKCKATGRGYSTMEIRPSELLDVYNPYIPKLNIVNSTVVKGAKNDSTTTIYCLATSGGKPMDVMVSYGGQDERFRIDHKNGNIRSQQETDEGTLLTLTVPTRSIERPTSWLYCGAENEFGDDWMQFYLPHYGID